MRVFVLLLALLVSACGDTFVLGRRACAPSAPAGLSPERRDSLQPFDAHAHPNADWARLARTTPGGFAGVYFEALPANSAPPDRHRPVVIRLTRPEERDAALRALLPQLPPTFGGLAIDSSDVRIVRAKFDFAQLDEWQRYLTGREGTKEIAGVGIDPSRNQIGYDVVGKPARSAMARRLRELGVPCGLVDINVVDAYAVPASNPP